MRKASGVKSHLRAVLFSLANGTVLDWFGPPTRGGIVPQETVRFRIVPHAFTLQYVDNAYQ